MTYLAFIAFSLAGLAGLFWTFRRDATLAGALLVGMFFVLPFAGSALGMLFPSADDFILAVVVYVAILIVCFGLGSLAALGVKAARSTVHRLGRSNIDLKRPE